MQKKKMLQEFLGHRFLVFALFMLIFSGGLKAAEEEYQKKKFCFRFVNVVLFEMQSCAFWGASPHVYFWEHQHDTEDNTFVCSLFRKEESGFQVPDGYLESVLSMTSGDSLTIVCESVDFTEKSYAVDR